MFTRLLVFFFNQLIDLRTLKTIIIFKRISLYLLIINKFKWTDAQCAGCARLMCGVREYNLHVIEMPLPIY